MCAIKIKIKSLKYSPTMIASSRKGPVNDIHVEAAGEIGIKI